MHLPAELDSLPSLHAFVDEFVSVLDGQGARESRLHVAAGEIAAMLIVDACPGTDLRLMVVSDEEDVYVRMSADRRDPDRGLDLSNARRSWLASMVQSLDVCTDHGRSYAVLQNARPEP